MRLNVLALAGAFLALTTAAAQASPATVLPDTGHAIARGAKQIFNGTKKGVTDQYDHDKVAARRTVSDARHGTLLHHHHRHMHHRYASRTVHTHRVVHHEG